MLANPVLFTYVCLSCPWDLLKIPRSNQFCILSRLESANAIQSAATKQFSWTIQLTTEDINGKYWYIFFFCSEINCLLGNDCTLLRKSQVLPAQSSKNYAPCKSICIGIAHSMGRTFFRALSNLVRSFPIHLETKAVSIFDSIDRHG